jgi:predicted transcriptional regulator
MIVSEVVAALGLTVAAGKAGLGREVRGGYASDLLSCVMAGAEPGDVWVTLQAHPNVVAVADLRDLACVVISEDATPDEETLGRAEERGIPMLISAEDTFTVVGRLTRLGVA